MQALTSTSNDMPDIHHDTLEEQIPISEMFIDPTYSRSIDWPFVNRLAKNWDRSKAGVVYLSLRETGKYAIIDGCHRVEACRVAEGDGAPLPARVFLYLTVQQEAALWDAFNRYRRRPHGTDVFRARLAAGDEVALKIARAVERAGLRLRLAGVQTKARDVVAVVALEEAIGRVGEHGLATILGILKEAFDEPRGFQAPAINGLSMFWARYGHEVDRSRVVDCLKRVGATRMQSLAVEYKSIDLGMPLAGAWARVLRMQYNKGLRTKQLVEW